MQPSLSLVERRIANVKNIFPHAKIRCPNGFVGSNPTGCVPSQCIHKIVMGQWSSGYGIFCKDTTRTSRLHRENREFDPLLAHLSSFINDKELHS
jgi:hypothetical protein